MEFEDIYSWKVKSNMGSALNTAAKRTASAVIACQSVLSPEGFTLDVDDMVKGIFNRSLDRYSIGAIGYDALFEDAVKGVMDEVKELKGFDVSLDKESGILTFVVAEESDD